MSRSNNSCLAFTGFFLSGKHKLTLSFFAWMVFFLPFGAMGQFSITGRILNQADTKPVANASVFISNATNGDKTSATGVFTLKNVKPGKYTLVISVIGFEEVDQAITVYDKNVNLPDILIFPKTILLNEVKVRPVTDPNRERNYEWFKNEFLGTSQLARECKILNPEMLDLNFDEVTNTLTASSVTFLEIENDALGYKIKYMLNTFTLQNNDSNEKKTFYQGPVLFEELKGTPAEERRWKKRREEIYKNSSMHFLRSALANRLDQEGFRVLRVANYPNPARQPDSLINARIKFYTENSSNAAHQQDSLAFWFKRSKLPKSFPKLMPFPLNKQDLIGTTDQPDQYTLGCEGESLLVAYNKDHRYHMNDQFNYLYNESNTENTLINFNAAHAFFGSNGVVTNPYSLIYYGVWGKNRVSELLPIDYEPADEPIQAIPSHPFGIDPVLVKYLSAQQPEKIYLQFDKPVYAAGDTVYFKAYAVNSQNNKLTDRSGVLYVDLVNSLGKAVHTIKLPLDSGITWGDITLPDPLPGGNYIIQAYTKWADSDVPAALFSKTIPIMAAIAKTSNLPPVKRPIKDMKPDIQFLPEGGTLIAGVPAKVAFKAVAPDGSGINVTGIISDNNGKEITTFASAHLGMGYFNITPTAGIHYTAKVNFSNGAETHIDLPAATEGIALTVNNGQENVLGITVSASNSYYLNNKQKEFTLLVYAGEATKTISFVLNGPTVNLKIDREQLRTGVSVITLFSPGKEPLCERQLFIQKHEQLDLTVSTEKKLFAKRDKVSIHIKATGSDEPAPGHFSASVFNESVVPVGKQTGDNILSWLLLTSDLKGYIEQPAYYFSDTGKTVKNDLDILMLTQGYHRFVWKDILDTTTSHVNRGLEDGLSIAGQVTNLFDQPVGGGTVTLVPQQGGPMLSTKTDASGKFKFTGLDFSDTGRYVLAAVTAGGKNSSRISWIAEKEIIPSAPIDQLPDVKPFTDTAFSKFIGTERSYLSSSRLNGNRIMLKQVVIREHKKNDQYSTQSLAGAGHADQIVHREQIEKLGGQFSDIFNALLRGVTFWKQNQGTVAYLTFNIRTHTGTNLPTPMEVIVDGEVRPIGIDINDIITSDIETVEVLENTSAAIYGVEGAGGVLVITTRQGSGRSIKDVTSTGILPISPIGFYKAKEFYAPKYDHPIVGSEIPDMRSTIYWKPELVTDKNGNASFDYYNADTPGTYTVIIEGIDNNGNVGRQIYSYKVE